MKVTISMDESLYSLFKEHSAKNKKTLSAALRSALLNEIKEQKVLKC